MTWQSLLAIIVAVTGSLANGGALAWHTSNPYAHERGCPACQAVKAGQEKQANE